MSIPNVPLNQIADEIRQVTDKMEDGGRERCAEHNAQLNYEQATRPTWSSKPPVERGFYWVRGNGHYSLNGGPCVVCVDMKAGCLHVWVPHMDFSDPLDQFVEECGDCEWSGPVKMPW